MFLNFIYILFIFSSSVYGKYSQFNQDTFIFEHFFKLKKGVGFFIELGANDGKYCSNSLFFEELGWKGVCVEPHTIVYEKLKENRPKSINLKVGVAPYTGEAIFKEVLDTKKETTSFLSGIIVNFSQEHKERTDGWIQGHGANFKMIKIDCLNVNRILELAPNNYIDYLSIDIEGGELEVLKAIDWEIFFISVLSVENNENLSDFKNYMNSINYTYITRLGVDDIYVHNRFQF